MSLLKPTYELVKGPEAMPWNEYDRRVREEWRLLLDSNPMEGAVQRFLEQHPALVPGFRSMSLASGHYPHPAALISQPKLLGLTTKIPDFLWIAKASDMLLPTFIEIERPAKRWFRKRGKRATPVATGEFSEAKAQLASWRNWFREPVNLSWFQRYYEVPVRDLKSLTMRPAFVLVYGRRREFAGDPAANRHRAEMVGEDEHLMTFDRLEPSEWASNFMTCRKASETGFEAVAIPPTFEWVPGVLENHVAMRDMADAIAEVPWVSAPRRAFLLERLPYWSAWARMNETSVLEAGAAE